jgi:hypothetical protein
VSDGGDLTEGRVRRGRTLLVGALGLALLLSLPLLVELLTPGRPAARSGPSPGSVAGVPAPAPVGTSRSGRLVYVGVDPNDSGVPRLVSLDLASGAYEIGPAVRDLDPGARLAAVGPGRSWLALIHRPPGEETVVADVIRDLTDPGPPDEVARGVAISLSPDGGELLVAELEEAGSAPGCRDGSQRLTLARVAVATGRSTPAYRGSPACGGAVEPGAILAGGEIVVNEVHGGARVAVLVGPEGEDPLVRGVVAGSASGVYLFARRGTDLLVWPGAGAFRPVVTGRRLRGAVVAASPDGRYVVVDGAIRDEAGLWIADVAAGTVRVGPGSLPPRSETFAQAVAADGTVFLVGHEGILAVEGASVAGVPLPPAAPEPVLGPVAWLP